MSGDGERPFVAGPELPRTRPGARTASHLFADPAEGWRLDLESAAGTTVEDMRNSGATGGPLRWQELLRLAYREPRSLGEQLALPEATVVAAEASMGAFRLFAPAPYVSRIRPGDPSDPLLLQVWPSPEETEERPGFLLDPVGDGEAERRPGVIQKYAGRALLVLTGACAIHCRYCFRRHFPYAEVPHSLEQWRPALTELAADRSIGEIILSGGDPLSLREEAWQELVEHLAAMPHLRRVRIHTRWPVVIPQRIDERWLGQLAMLRQPVVVVVHVNHPREIDASVVQALDRMRAAGCLLLNQSVLLRGVNDSLDTLADLSEQLLAAGVVPYYLHQLDRVAGAWHFEVSDEEALRLVEGLRTRLPGYAVPRLVRDEPGQPSKVWLA
jgi:EF-P beta-lysylation protein EpmB